MINIQIFKSQLLEIGKKNSKKSEKILIFIVLVSFDIFLIVLVTLPIHQP